MVFALLDHVDKNKGDGGLYIKNGAKAYEEAARLISAQHPRTNVTSLQVKAKCRSLIRYNPRDSTQQAPSSLFCRGRKALSEEYLDLLKGHPPSNSIPVSRAIARGIFPKKPGRRPARDLATSNPSGRSLDTITVRGPKITTVNVPRSMSLSTDSSPALSEQPLPKVQMRRSMRTVDKEVENPSVEPTSTSRQDVSFDTGEHQSGVARHSDCIQSMVLSMKEQERAMSIRKYLINDPELFEPSVEHLRNRMTNLLFNIENAVKGLFEASCRPEDDSTDTHAALNHEKQPKISAALGEQPFFDLCKRLFGALTRASVYDNAIKTYVLLADFLKAMLAAAISDWVFNGLYPCLSGDILHKTKASLIFEDRIAERK